MKLCNSYQLTLKIFQIGLKQIIRDGMLFVLLPAPFLIGLFIKFFLPLINIIVEKQLYLSLVPYYGLIDGFLICMTPLFTAMVCSFILLEERDEGIVSFYQITPASSYSYLAARIGIPMLWAFSVTIITLLLFNISGLNFWVILITSFISTLAGLFMAMLVVSLAGNRVEGLALSKLIAVSLLGIFIIWFVPSPYHFLSAFLPSFWIGKILMEGPNIFVFTLAALICFIWITFFTKKFLKRIA